MVRDNFVIVLILVLLAPLSGCDASKLDGSDSLLPDASIEDLYLNNKSSIKALVEFCTSSPSVKWLGVKPTDMELSTVLSSKPDSAAVNKAKKTLSDVGAESLMCTRDWGEADYPLVSVTVPLYGAGISVSGVSKGIRFFSNVSDYVQARIKAGELKSLGDEGWYIYLSAPN